MTIAVVVPVVVADLHTLWKMVSALLFFFIPIFLLFELNTDSMQLHM